MSSCKENVSNILLVAITRMGDMLQASPTILGLREEYPNAKITVLIEKQFASICDGIPGIDELFVIDLAFVCRCLSTENEGVVDAFKYISDIVDDLQSRNFDFCLNMSSSSYTALLLKMLDVKDSRGWVSDDEGLRLITNPWAMLFAAFVFHSNRDFNSINLVDIFRCSAGVRAHPKSLKYEVPEKAQGAAERFLESENLTGAGPLICIQAGASQEKRQWDLQKFADVSRLLVEKLDARIIFTGSASEKPIIERILQLYSHDNIGSACGKTNLSELADILKSADLLVTGDTGPMHLAVAVGTPVVALFLASALCFETGPYSEGNFVLQPQVSCNPCNPNYPCSRPDCHDQISPELVVHMCELRLSHPIEKLEGFNIPNELADPAEVAVYITAFDADDFLEFRALNGEGPGRKGFLAEFYQNNRKAYRRLWKEEFGAVDPKPLPQLPPEQLEPELGKVPGLDRMVKLTKDAQDALIELKRLILDTNSPPNRLGEVNREVHEIERKIEDLGLGYPNLGALVRLFIMEKQRWLDTLIDEMRSIMDGVPAVPSPSRFKCKRCDVREICEHSVYNDKKND